MLVDVVAVVDMETGVMIVMVAVEADLAAVAVVVDETDVAAAAEAALGDTKSPRPFIR
jgi:hypothetical protein